MITLVVPERPIMSRRHASPLLFLVVPFLIAGGAHGPVGRTSAQPLLPKPTEIGRFKVPTGTVWLLLRGPGRATGPAGQALYVVAAADSGNWSKHHEPWHLPGRLIDAGNQQAYYEAEVFAGEVLRDTLGVIWYDRSLMPDGQWKENTTLLNLSSAVPDTMVFFGHARRSTTMGLAFRGKCLMLDSLDQRMRP